MTVIPINDHAFPDNRTDVLVTKRVRHIQEGDVRIGYRRSFLNLECRQMFSSSAIEVTSSLRVPRVPGGTGKAGRHVEWRRRCVTNCQHAQRAIRKRREGAAIALSPRVQ